MKGYILMAAVAAAVCAASAGAASQPPGWYWTPARATAAFQITAWYALTDPVGLRCQNDGAGPCNFTVSCRGLASNPTLMVPVRDVLKVGPSRYRFRYFRCVVNSTCLLAPWTRDVQTLTGAPANPAFDAERLLGLSSAKARANPNGCG